jgi:hypothetical protein
MDTKMDMISLDKNNPRSGIGVARVCPIVYHLYHARAQLAPMKARPYLRMLDIKANIPIS